jgi:hypothetical protein
VPHFEELHSFADASSRAGCTGLTYERAEIGSPVSERIAPALAQEFLGKSEGKYVSAWIVPLFSTLFLSRGFGPAACVVRESHGVGSREKTAVVSNMERMT